MALLLDGSHAGELTPELVPHGLQQLNDLELDAVLGADLHERTEVPSGYRKGRRSRLLTTQVVKIPIIITKLCSGSFFVSILESRRRIVQAVYALIMVAWAGLAELRHSKLEDLEKLEQVSLVEAEFPPWQSESGTTACRWISLSNWSGLVIS